MSTFSTDPSSYFPHKHIPPFFDSFPIRSPHLLEKLDKSEYVHEEVDTNKDEQNERSDEDYDREDEE